LSVVEFTCAAVWEETGSVDADGGRSGVEAVADGWDVDLRDWAFGWGFAEGRGFTGLSGDEAASGREDGDCGFVHKFSVFGGLMFTG
jgi:hypothetical protein